MGSTIVPPVEMIERRLRSFELANEVKRKRPLLLARLHALATADGLRWSADAISDPPALLSGVSVFKLLKTVRGLPTKAIDGLLDDAGITALDRLGDLSDEQRTHLVIELHLLARRLDRRRSR